MYLCGARNQRRSARLLYVYTASMLSRRTRLFFLGGRGGEVSNLKGLKRFPRRVARRIVGPRTPIDRRLFLAPVALDPLSPLLELPLPRSGRDLLRTFKRTMSLSGRVRPSLSTRKISGSVKNGADGQRAPAMRLVSSRLVSFRHDTCCWNRVVCRV